MEDPNRGGGIEPIKKKLKEQIETVNRLIVNLDRNKDAIVNVLQYLTPPEMYVVMRSATEDREFADTVNLWKLTALAKYGFEEVSKWEGVLLGTTNNNTRVVTRHDQINYFHLMFVSFLTDMRWWRVDDFFDENYSNSGHWEEELELDVQYMFKFKGEDSSTRVLLSIGGVSKTVEFEGYYCYLVGRSYIFVFMEEGQTTFQKKIFENLEDSLNVARFEEIEAFLVEDEDKGNLQWLSARYITTEEEEASEFTKLRLLYKILQIPGASVEYKWQTKDVPSKTFIVTINKKI